MSAPAHWGEQTVIHTIAVPAGMSIEQVWEAIMRGDTPQLPADAQVGWVNVLTVGDRFIRVLPSHDQLRERARDAAQAAEIASVLDGCYLELVERAVADAADRGITVDGAALLAELEDAVQSTVGRILDDVDPRPAAG